MIVFYHGSEILLYGHYYGESAQGSATSQNLARDSKSLGFHLFHVILVISRVKLTLHLHFIEIAVQQFQ